MLGHYFLATKRPYDATTLSVCYKCCIHVVSAFFLCSNVCFHAPRWFFLAIFLMTKCGFVVHIFFMHGCFWNDATCFVRAGYAIMISRSKFYKLVRSASVGGSSWGYSLVENLSSIPVPECHLHRLSNRYKTSGIKAPPSYRLLTNRYKRGLHMGHQESSGPRSFDTGW
jgi:hypothetical protein